MPHEFTPKLLGAIQRVGREFEVLHGYLHAIAFDKVVCRSATVRPRILSGLHLDELLVGKLRNSPDTLSRLVLQIFTVFLAVER